MNKKLDMMIRYRDLSEELKEVVKKFWDLWEEDDADGLENICDIQSIAEIDNQNVFAMSLDEWYHEIAGTIESLDEAIEKEKSKLIPVPLKAEDFANYDGSKVTIGGQEFDFYLDGDLAVTLNIFSNDEFRILATVNYDCRGVPINVEEFDGDIIDSLFVEVEVKDFDQYLEIVKEQIDSYFRDIGAESFDDLVNVKVVRCGWCDWPAQTYFINDDDYDDKPRGQGCINPNCDNKVIELWNTAEGFPFGSIFNLRDMRRSDLKKLQKTYPHAKEIK